MLSGEQRNAFDELLDGVIECLPGHVREMLDEVPVIVEDYPSEKLLDELKMKRDRSVLCGLHWGTPLTERSVEHGPMLPDRIMLFREPIMQVAGIKGAKAGLRPDHHLKSTKLREQIHITLLHEIGHHFGLDEDDLAALGYG